MKLVILSTKFAQRMRYIYGIAVLVNYAAAAIVLGI
jgi:hypothetical protein